MNNPSKFLGNELTYINKVLNSEIWSSTEGSWTGKLEKEFLNKRIQLYEILWSYDYKAPKAFFIDLDYNTEFDDFLLNQVGYDKLALLMQGVFISPYAATSLREYFATGFTDFFMNKSRDDLKSVSPVLYNKLRSLSLGDFD